MRRFALLMLCCVPAGLGAQEATDAVRQAEVLSVVRSFHSALAAGDSAAAITHLHPDVVVYENGHAENLDQYRGGHLPADMAFAAATEREVTSQSTALWGDQALHTSETHTTGHWRGRDIDSHGAETMVLVRTSEGWRIRHIHWSSR